jgi:hypothetical protein
MMLTITAVTGSASRSRKMGSACARECTILDGWSISVAGGSLPRSPSTVADKP